MRVYCDTSALIKLWVQEEGAERFRRLAVEADGLGTSALARVELHSALSRLRREGRLSEAQLAELLVDVDDHLAAMTVVGLDRTITEDAAELVRAHSLKALDGLHLATALALQDAENSSPWVFATFDLRLARAAVAEGFAVSA